MSSTVHEMITQGKQPKNTVREQLQHERKGGFDALASRNYLKYYVSNRIHNLLFHMALLDYFT